MYVAMKGEFHSSIMCSAIHKNIAEGVSQYLSAGSSLSPAPTVLVYQVQVHNYPGTN